MAGSDRGWGWVRLSENGRGEWGKWDGVAGWNERVRVGFISLYIYIYIWFFGNFSFNRVRVGFESKFRASFIKTWTRFRFYFKNSNPTLLFYGSGKTRPLRVKLGRIPTGRVLFAIPNRKPHRRCVSSEDSDMVHVSTLPLFCYVYF